MKKRNVYYKIRLRRRYFLLPDKYVFFLSLAHSLAWTMILMEMCLMQKHELYDFIFMDFLSNSQQKQRQRKMKREKKRTHEIIAD